jgi:NAD(P)-dependent dehydrogenase (short-subunit alcohol dehydrogenase family)
VDLLEYAEWDRIIRINLTSMYLTAKHVMPCMLWLKRGSIIHISSLQAFLGFKGYPAYAASKAGIVGLTRQMAAEYAPQGIRVNCIAPGNVDTPQSNKVLERSPEPEKVLALWKKMHPLGRRGKPRDIAYAALYLACDESEWVTGQCLVVDGGLSISAPS